MSNLSAHTDSFRAPEAGCRNAGGLKRAAAKGRWLLA